MRERSEHQQRVDQFMRLVREARISAGLPDYEALPTKPEIPSMDVRRLRALLILEETLETIEALGFKVEFRQDDPTMDDSITMESIELTALRTVSMIGVVDGCCDIHVVTTGTLSAFGVSDVGPLRLVDENNLAKFGPGHGIRPDGKLIKPPSHKPPALLAELNRQYDPLKNTKSRNASYDLLHWH
jgi:predicted HAD superfamily Cof-like phosphohydrolase